MMADSAPAAHAMDSESRLRLARMLTRPGPGRRADGDSGCPSHSQSPSLPARAVGRPARAAASLRVRPTQARNLHGVPGRSKLKNGTRTFQVTVPTVNLTRKFKFAAAGPLSLTGRLVFKFKFQVERRLGSSTGTNEYQENLKGEVAAPGCESATGEV
jgi:hypothetical protein